jgi:hypothetical protein
MALRALRELCQRCVLFPASALFSARFSREASFPGARGVLAFLARGKVAARPGRAAPGRSGEGKSALFPLRHQGPGPGPRERPLVQEVIKGMKKVFVPALGLLALGLLAAPVGADWEAPPPTGTGNPAYSPAPQFSPGPYGPSPAITPEPYGPGPAMTPGPYGPAPHGDCSCGSAPQVVYSPAEPCGEPCCPRRGLLGRIRDRIRERLNRTPCTECCSPCPAPRMTLLDRIRARRAERRACCAPPCPCPPPCYSPGCPTCPP